MGIAEKLELLVTLDPSQGVAGLEKMSQAAEANGKKTEDALGRVGASAMKIGVAGLAAGTFLTQLGDKEKQASAGLEAAISAAGQSVEDYRDRIEAAVKSGENFGHNAVDTNNALNTLVGSFGDTGKALDQMQLVEDLAAKKHISLADAAQNVAKAHGGAGRIFKEFNIQVGENADGTKNYDAALGQLSQKLSGQASASMQGFSGWLSKTTAQVEDQVAAFGAKYGPAIMAGSAALTAFGAISSGVSAILGKVAAAHAAAATAAELQAAAEAEAIVAEQALTANSAATVASLYAVEGATVASGAAFGPWGLAVAAGVAVAVTAYDTFIGGSDDLKLKLGELTKYAQESGQDLYVAYTNIKWEGDPGQLSQWLDMLEHGGAEGIGVLTKLRASLVANGMATDDVDAAIARANDDQKNLNDTVALGGKAMDEASKASEGYLGFISDLAGAMDKSYQSGLSSMKLSSSYASAVNSLEDSLKKNGTTLDVVTDKYGHFNEKALANQSAVLAVGESIAKLIEQRFQDTHSIDAAVASGDMYVEGLKQQLAAAGYNTDQIAKMIDTMNLTPEKIRSEFDNNAVEQQIVVQKYVASFKDIPPEANTEVQALIDQGRFDEANAALDNLAHGRAVYYTPYANQSTATLIITNKPGAQFADGGLVPGPKGSPLEAVVHGGEFVLTADQVEAATRGGRSPAAVLPGAGVTFAPVIHVSALDPQGAALAVGEALREFVRTYPVPDALRQAFN